MYRVGEAMTTGNMYPEILSDSLLMIKIFFSTTMLLWFVLWGVKFAFLMLYRRLFAGIRFYMRLWWAVLVFCIVTLVGSVISNFVSCSSMDAWFTPGACTTRRDVHAQITSLYFSYAVDVVTDLMIMFLPLGLIWKLQRPRAQKIGIGALFCVSWICIVAATIRVVSIGVKSGSSSTPSSTWLAFWAVIESSIAVIIGCCPGLYATAKEVQKTRQGTSQVYGYAGNYPNGSRGYEKQPTSGEMGSIRMKHIPIQIDGSSNGQWKNSSKRPSATFWKGDDDDESREELKPGQILVTSSVEVSDANSIDHDADRRPKVKNFSMV
jgi:hypothetical protein